MTKQMNAIAARFVANVLAGNVTSNEARLMATGITHAAKTQGADLNACNVGQFLMLARKQRETAQAQARFADHNQMMLESLLTRRYSIAL